MLCDHLEGWDKEGGRETQEGPATHRQEIIFLTFQSLRNTELKKERVDFELGDLGLSPSSVIACSLGLLQSCRISVSSSVK